MTELRGPVVYKLLQVNPYISFRVVKNKTGPIERIDLHHRLGYSREKRFPVQVGNDGVVDLQKCALALLGMATENLPRVRLFLIVWPKRESGVLPQYR